MSTMKILGQPVVMTANGSIEPLKILKSFVNDDNFLVEIPLVASGELPDGVYDFKVGFRIERLGEDSVFCELMMSDAKFTLNNQSFKLNNSNLKGTISGANLEGEFFFNETMDLPLLDFFHPTDTGICLNLHRFRDAFEDDEAPDLLEIGEYEYTLVFSPESEHFLSGKLGTLDKIQQAFPIPMNKKPVRLSTDDFTFEENTVAAITGLYMLG